MLSVQYSFWYLGIYWPRCKSLDYICSNLQKNILSIFSPNVYKGFNFIIAWHDLVFNFYYQILHRSVFYFLDPLKLCRTMKPVHTKFNVLFLTLTVSIWHPSFWFNQSCIIFRVLAKEQIVYLYMQDQHSFFLFFYVCIISWLFFLLLKSNRMGEDIFCPCPWSNCRMSAK